MCVPSHFRFFATLWTAAHQAPLSMGFSRQEYWSGLPCPPPGDLSNSGIEPVSPDTHTHINIHIYINVNILYKGLKRKSRKSRNTWSNRQIWCWNTEGSRAKANRILPREHTGHRKHPLPTIQDKTLYMDITRWSTLESDWLYSLQPKMEKLYTVSKNKTRSWLWLRPWTPYCQIQTEIEETRENH